MEAIVHPATNQSPSTLYRLLLRSSDSPLDGELYYEDDELRFREKNLDIQDFAPSFIDIYSYMIIQEHNESPLHDEQTKETQLQVFIYSFSYLPDPTWLVNWENGANMDEWFEMETKRLNEKTRRLELETGEYLTGALLEVGNFHSIESLKGLRIVSFKTSNNREVNVMKCSMTKKKTTQYYELTLPDGFGIIGRFPAPITGFGFYISWMVPRSWSTQKHVWYPLNFRHCIRSLLLSFHRLAQDRSYDEIPFVVLERIIQILTQFEFSKLQFDINDESILIEEL